MKFLNSLIEEFKRVEWPTKKQITKYSLYTLLFLVVSSIGIGLLDVFFAFGRSWLISYISNS